MKYFQFYLGIQNVIRFRGSKWSTYNQQIISYSILCLLSGLDDSEAAAEDDEEDADDCKNHEDDESRMAKVQ